jgi:hypothetical protein
MRRARNCGPRRKAETFENVGFYKRALTLTSSANAEFGQARHPSLCKLFHKPTKTFSFYKV